MQVRERIDQIDRALGRVGADTVFEGRGEPSRQDRGAREAMVPGDRLSSLIETGGYAVEEIGSVHVVLNVFLAGQHDLDGAVDMLRDLDGASDTIDFQPAAESTADQMIMDNDLVQGQTSGLRRRRLGARDG